MCSDAIGCCDCDAAVCKVPDQRKARLERHVRGYGACHEDVVNNCFTSNFSNYNLFCSCDDRVNVDRRL